MSTCPCHPAEGRVHVDRQLDQIVCRRERRRAAASTGGRIAGAAGETDGSPFIAGIAAGVEVRSSRPKEAGWLFAMEFAFLMLSGVARVGAPDNYHAIYERHSILDGTE